MTQLINTVAIVALVAFVIIVLISSLRVVNQATVAVVTLFGKYRRVLHPGLNILIPFFERINRTVQVQNRTEQL